MDFFRSGVMRVCSVRGLGSVDAGQWAGGVEIKRVRLCGRKGLGTGSKRVTHVWGVQSNVLSIFERIGIFAVKLTSCSCR